MQEELLDLSLIGVTEKKKKQFNSKDIQDIRDLLLYFPRSYKEYHLIDQINEGKTCFIMQVNSVASRTSKSGIPYILAVGACKKKTVFVMWFRQSYKFSEIQQYEGSQVLVAGKASYDAVRDTFTVASPDLFTLPARYHKEIIFPIYAKIRGMSEEYLAECIYKATQNYIPVLSTAFPAGLMRKFGLLSYQEAVYRLHFPRDMKDVKAGLFRLHMEDLYYFACMTDCHHSDTSRNVHFKAKKSNVMVRVIQHLPYTLTHDQQKTLQSLCNFVDSGNAIHAMIQGDVGCGKSIIAFLLAVKMAENGFQTAIIAPTSVLAQQHYKELARLVKNYTIDVAYIPPLTSLKKKERTELLAKTSSQKGMILVGTHSLLSEQIKFCSLGMVITDEEHKFGVEQRSKLLAESNSGIHYISMSATPIPRSLASVIYGESTQLYQITTMPPGRKPVQTAISKNINACFRFLHRQINTGRQAYIVCPQIEESDSNEDVASVNSLLSLYQKEFGIEQVAALTGKNSKAETANILQRFCDNQISILIATTVIEVGVNVPNANSIIIHNAERFGLASLHQLRGRVGRGGGDAYCILFSEDQGNARLQAMCETTNGFEIAEKDLQLRGAGNLFGIEQSGNNKYIDLIMEHPEEYRQIRQYIKKAKFE